MQRNVHGHANLPKFGKIKSQLPAYEKNVLLKVKMIYMYIIHWYTNDDGYIKAVTSKYCLAKFQGASQLFKSMVSIFYK